MRFSRATFSSVLTSHLGRLVLATHRQDEDEERARGSVCLSSAGNPAAPMGAALQHGERHFGPGGRDYHWTYAYPPGYCLRRVSRTES